MFLKVRPVEPPNRRKDNHKCIIVEKVTVLRPRVFRANGRKAYGNIPMSTVLAKPNVEN